jgi:ligand-binding SRPBCC domain-containing protein
VKTLDFSSSQLLDRPLDELFPFFAEAANLGRITPPWLQFEILTPGPVAMAPGTLIDYRIRWRGLPMRWRSEIAVWEPPHRFVDRQIRGPYRLWHHEHTFAERDGGTLISDSVRYAVWGGALIERLFVRRDVAAIFEFRRRRLTELFPPKI